MDFPGATVSRSDSSLFGHATSSLVPSPVKSSSSNDANRNSSWPSTSPSFQPYKICYPMMEAKSSTTGKDDMNHDRTNWVGRTPLEMIELIVSMAESSTGFVSLSESDSQLQVGRSSLQNFLTDTQSVQHAGQKRKHEVVNEDMDIDLKDDSLVAALVDSVDVQHLDNTFKPWLPSSSVGESTHITGLDSMVTNFELMLVDLDPGSWILPSYNRVQQLFVSNVVDGDDTNISLAAKNAISQMQVLTELVTSVKERKKAKASPALRLEAPPSTLAGKPPEAFNYLMTLWMKQNFCNPFPDEVVMKCLSNHLIMNRCIPLSKKDAKMLKGKGHAEYHRAMFDMAVEKINNWLVNKRTRKWRPSMEQAFNMKRPASLFLEDSLRIFEEKPLRPLVGWDSDQLFAADQKYSKNLKTWKTVKGEDRRKKAKALKKRREGKNAKKELNLSPAGFDVAQTPFDLSPCTAFMSAGGGDQMIVEDGDDVHMPDGTVVGEYAAI